MMCWACKGVGFYKLFWTVEVAEGVTATYLFLMPCARCSLPAYSVWLVGIHPKLEELHPHLILQEAFVAS